MKKIQVTFSDEQIDILTNFKGIFGDSNAEVVRNIVLSWLAEKSIITEVSKQKLKNMDEIRDRDAN